MKKKLVRLTEGDLHRIIKESVNRVIKEYYKKTGKEGFEMEHDHVSHGNDNVNDRKGAAAMNALGCNGEEMERIAKNDKGHGRYNRYSYDENKSYKNLNNLREYKARSTFRSRNEPNEGNGRFGGRWYASEEKGTMTFPYENFAWYLREGGLIQSEEQYNDIEDYFYSNSDSFTIYATFNSYRDSDIGEDTNIEPNENCLSNAINVISSCDIIDDRSKKYLIGLVNDFWDKNAYDSSKYELEEYEEQEQEYDDDIRY